MLTIFSRTIRYSKRTFFPYNGMEWVRKNIFCRTSGTFATGQKNKTATFVVKLYLWLGNIFISTSKTTFVILSPFCLSLRLCSLQVLNGTLIIAAVLLCLSLRLDRFIFNRIICNSSAKYCSLPDILLNKSNVYVGYHNCSPPLIHF